ncbi:MarR family winged helix-turn-helix transcriptional regulator [Sneathiella litorea]|uniref:MarR family transcriptional regulator n=1 Tax=Sneathiella litorea TaxID=2606216 RepID=A0A6L8WBT9_9PROT|nr:MarR family transcriptional regulator [Sneathiella litorea]MZR31587.1 MarR family transcriptional regulator [Sneathiella litorea]
MDQLNEALVSIRKILRATELHGKALRIATGLKTSQLIVLQALEESPELTVGEITAQVHMAQATVTMIVSRLEAMGFVLRKKGVTDKRKVFVSLTERGLEVLAQAPEALHERFAEEFEPLAAWEKSMMIASLQRVAAMLDASDIDAAPLLQLGEAHAHDAGVK